MGESNFLYSVKFITRRDFVFLFSLLDSCFERILNSASVIVIFTYLLLLINS